MTSKSALRRPVYNELKTLWLLTLVAVLTALFSTSLMAQQSGDIAGRVTDAADGSAIADVSIEATSPNLPGKRSVTTNANGDYSLRLLPPGVYTLTYSLKDGSTRVRQIQVLLQQRGQVDLAVDFGEDEGMLEEVIVVGTSILATDTGGAAISSSVNNELFEALPVGQEYRDLIKLIPGVQYTEDAVRGPNAGGSGQDNTYQFDGVDVSLPMFGSLSAEPSTHDIDQISIIRGGAKAIGFNRSGGFKVNTISKSGTDEFHGSASYQSQTAGMTSSRKADDLQDFDQDKSWITANIGGPIIKEKLYFYGSYYRPEVKRDNVSNAYGAVPNYKSVRNEYFAKLTYAPTDNLLFDASYRTSKRTGEHLSVDEFEAATTSVGEEATLDIGIVEGSWIINDRSNVYFKFTDFRNKTSSLPDTLFNFPIAIGDSLNINALDQQGYFSVPLLKDGEPDYNAFVQPLINQYGYDENGMSMGGGAVGGAPEINNQDFFRKSYEIGYDIQIEGKSTTHELHIGLHSEKIEEDLSRLSNGWGVISVPGGIAEFNDEPVYYQTTFQQMSLTNDSGILVPPIHSETKSRNVEVNDTIYWNNWTFNVGLLFSEDKLYGQGLKRNGDNVSGFEVALGHRYLMKEVSTSKMIQPRLGVLWDINDRTSMFANYARYYPSASSLSRAASWARNLQRTIRAYYDEDGNFIDVDPVRSSSGKVFQKGIDPRHIDEYLLGVTYQFTDRLTGRAHVRYRAARDFWEDTNNDARANPNYNAPDNIPHELYVENLSEIRDEIGGSSYVIAQLDNAYTDYWELNLEAEWVGDNFYLQGSYVYSDYTGNFDQDNTSPVNDANRFIGSSNIADNIGRQLWDLKDGTLRGDRPHQFKVYGTYLFNWNGSVGAYFVFQSGQPWESWDVEVYRDQLTANGSGSTSDTIRYAEKAGSHRTSSHTQMDLNYTQNFYLGSDDRYNIQLRADIFNVFNSQTGYDIQPRVNSAGYGDPRSWFNPRRVQLMARFIF
jgi:hypothetical protein